MRLLALTTAPTPIYNMSNGAGDIIEYIPEDKEITLVGSVRNGLTLYYSVEDLKGFIKQDYVKILRDEEFYYSAGILRKKENRSPDSVFELNLQLHASWLVGTATTVAGSILINKTSSKMGKMFKIGNDSATKLLTNSLGEILGDNIPIIKGISGAMGSSGNTDAGLGALFGDSTLGKMLNGATLTNLTDGSFFKEQLLKNAISMAKDYLNTILKKLEYVIGTTLAGQLIGIVNGININSTGKSIAEEIKRIWSRSAVDPKIQAREEQIKKYFQYNGCNGKMVTKIAYNDDGTAYAAWKQDAYYSTGTMASKKDPDQVKVHKELYNNMYDDWRDTLNAIKETVNLNISKDSWYADFNRHRLIHPDSVLTNSKGYIFFTRPDLNISTDLLSSDIGILFHNMSAQHPGIVDQLIYSMTGEHYFMPLLCNRCTGIDVPDENLEIKEVNETFTGYKINYAENLLKSKTSGTVNTGFIDDESLSVYLVFKLWAEYISAVSRGAIKPQEQYIKSKVIDYAISIYYFLTAADGETILYWTKFTGCIPTLIPSSNFTDNYNDPVKIPKYSISWQYAFKNDFDPFHLAEFNKLSTGSSFEYTNIYNDYTFRSPMTMHGAPFVDTTDTSKSFKLRFRKRTSGVK